MTVFDRRRIRDTLRGACAFIAITTATALAGQEKEKVLMMRTDDLRSEEARIRDSAVDAILAERKATIERLIPLIDPANAEKYSDETRAAAAYLLGEMRASEAAPVLAKALADQIGRDLVSNFDRYDDPVFGAIIKIGKPAIPALIENVRSTDDESFQYVSLAALGQILGGGWERVKTLLEKLVEQAQDEEPANREISRRLREAHARVESFHKRAIEKGEKPPLY